jgi:hypothetical protein
VLRIDNKEEALAVLGSSYSVRILDIEPWVLSWHADAGRLAEALTPWVEIGPAGVRVVLCTNSKRFSIDTLGVELVSHAQKPWTRRSRLGALGMSPVVVGDCLLLDGLLAFRLRADFIWLPWQDSAPLWPRAIHLLDALMAPFLLRSASKELS